MNLLRSPYSMLMCAAPLNITNSLASCKMLLAGLWPSFGVVRGQTGPAHRIEMKSGAPTPGDRRIMGCSAALRSPRPKTHGHNKCLKSASADLCPGCRATSFLVNQSVQKLLAILLGRCWQITALWDVLKQFGWSSWIVSGWSSSSSLYRFCCLLSSFLTISPDPESLVLHCV